MIGNLELIISLKKKLLNKQIYTDNFWLYSILFFAFIVRIIGVNYNTAFNDEAIYVVVGRMGIFTHDWWSYGATLWMAGLPYIYPPMSALAYELGGLSGARLLNIVFGVILVEEVYRFTKLLGLYEEKVNKLASLFAAFLVAFSGIGIFVSKLATYDMPSFLLFMLGINSFLKAKYFSNGKYYFLSFLFLFAAFLTKIVIAIFFPILFIFSLIIIKKRSIVHKKAVIKYLYVPFILATGIYTFFYFDNLMTYVNVHKSLGKTESHFSILRVIWEQAKVLILLFIPSALVLFMSKKIKALIALTILALAIPIFHYALLRYATLDKHTYLTVLFLSVLVGYAASLAISNKNKIISIGTKVIIPIIILFYFFNSNTLLYSRENDWKNTNKLQSYMKQKIQPGDKVLTEEGGVIILALYEKTFPPKNIVTFDWIDYSGMKDDKGYLLAVKDRYFDYIELTEKSNDTGPLEENIRKQLAINYTLVYKQSTFEVYEKNKN